LLWRGYLGKVEKQKIDVLFYVIGMKLKIEENTLLVLKKHEKSNSRSI
jgi:hypothetical protein